MRFTPLLLLAVGAAAFQIPKGQADGVYEVVTGADGKETHRLVGSNPDAVETRNAVPDKFSMAHKRGTSNSVNCGGYVLPQGDTDSANNYLDAQCGGGAGVGGGRDLYAIKGCTVAYFCNYTGGTQFCYAKERQETSRAITSVCGLYGAGWDQIQSDNRNVQYGYENNCNQGWNFCGRGMDGKKL
ncbi:Uncharacterized protein BP5553_08449 [Venustampulla echinocandica]|uniref:Uncharacterized protein n=1 Tax=Venustampulla echinocandica TaxID=2656787 RepID=A0A370TED7_9HELO|nr:Uncharacterized protein BP5553_08449 [Venustampulla echinocandica]RDL33010.1 Uncharacterized protein BP5553_08449 [Venustampulla echinocandica]